ncbi:rhodanese-like domain-containing protein [Candidatus Gottesmanbacteria bacterium]|nr:rhodanese-like domain-containing protein [Candidatus Gottesmanbacteria bacterium]
MALLLIGFFLGKNADTFQTVNPLSFFRPNNDAVSARTLTGMLKNKNFTFINVHTPYEGEIEKTDTFIPYDQIVANSGSLPKDKNTLIILYCKSGRMSAEALETVRKLGYTNVRHLTGGMDAWKRTGSSVIDLSNLETQVIPASGVELPVSWGSIGPRLIAAGVIDETKFRQAVKLTPEQEEILTRGSEQKIRITAANSQFVVDLLWALGLAQKSTVYDQGPMGKEYKKDAANFSSTGGWTLARGNAMQYLNTLDLMKLTPEQHKRVGDIAQNVYRPCCGNSTWFPDCNHGMAALAAIELMVAANLDDKTIYKNVVTLNTYWFSDTYLTIATHFARQGVSWQNVDAKMVLGKDYSSSQGAQEIKRKVGPLPYKPEQKGGGCGA